jgi:putative glutamine amidotransferase
MRSKKPVIGITLSQTSGVETKRWPSRYQFDWLGKTYHYAIEKSGGVPIGLFNTESQSAIKEYLGYLDGILFTGGGDIDPKRFGQVPHPATKITAQPRDQFELSLLKEGLKAKLPIFCICRGHQILNTLLKGTLYQDLSLYANSLLPHADPDQTGKIDHEVTLAKESLLYEIVGSTKIICNSSHHQFINKLGRNLTATAISPDGIIEGVELANYPFLISVQWHPERIFERPHSKKLFKAFVKKASQGT